eukprot:11024621-Ditylum_brightwellii.AAC.1
MEHHLIGYSQHVQGIHNDIPDCLSHDFHLSEDQLTFLFLSLLPDKMMRSFRCTGQGRQVVNPSEV